MSALKLCVLSSEFLPYAKTGGLADVVGRAGAESARSWATRCTPSCRCTPRFGPRTRNSSPFSASSRSRWSSAPPNTASPCRRPVSRVRTLRCISSIVRRCTTAPDFYTTDPDEHRRFLLFTRARLESCRRLGFAPDIFHCNDWHTAFLPLYLKTLYASEPLLAAARSVLTIHNIGYQGVMPGAARRATWGWAAPRRWLDGDRPGARRHQPLENRHKICRRSDHRQPDLRA